MMSRNNRLKEVILKIIPKLSYLPPGALEDNKYLSWVYGVDRNICHEGH